MNHPIPGLKARFDPAASRNPMLRALVREAAPRVLQALELVTVTTGEVVYDNILRADHVWMPLSCVLSGRVTLPDGASMEAALHGDEGFVGIWSTSGAQCGRGRHFDARVIAMRGGLAWCLPVAAFRGAWNASPAVRLALLTLQTAWGAEVLVRAICNRHHRIDRQLCRWLMLYRERARSDELVATHQGLADILSVRREGVTEALGHLAHAGALELRRGGLRIVDAARVAANVCGCYRSETAPRFSATNARPTKMNAIDRPAALRTAAG